jgi:hypothetical protein
MAYIYEIRVKGHLGQRWSDWFDRLTIYQESNGETKMSGLLSDQAALFGVLNKIQALHLVLISVSRISPSSAYVSFLAESCALRLSVPWV